MRHSRFVFFFRRSVSERKGRVIVASLSVMFAVSLVTGMVSITTGIREKVGSELRAYGANIIISPQKGDALDYAMLKEISGIESVEGVEGQVFSRTNIGKQTVEVIGMDVKELKARGWRLNGSWPEKQGELLAGINLKTALKFKTGDIASLDGVAGKRDFRISGFTENGGTEDNSLIMAIPDAWQISGSENKLDAILVRGKSGRLDDITEKIRKTYPLVSVKTLRQIAMAEESLLRKIQLLMAMVTAVVLFATSVSVASTMGANVLERREEIGLMKALGAKKKEISAFYMTEAALIGLIGGVSGFVLGASAAEAVSRGAFNSFISISFYLPFVSLLVGLSISSFAAYFPVRDAMKYDPAVILRGE